MHNVCDGYAPIAQTKSPNKRENSSRWSLLSLFFRRFRSLIGQKQKGSSSVGGVRMLAYGRSIWCITRGIHHHYGHLKKKKKKIVIIIKIIIKNIYISNDLCSLFICYSTSSIINLFASNPRPSFTLYQSTAKRDLIPRFLISEYI